MAKEKVNIRCACGAIVEGFSEQHCDGNLELHQRSKKHRELMEIAAYNRASKETGRTWSPSDIELLKGGWSGDFVAARLKYLDNEIKRGRMVGCHQFMQEAIDARKEFLENREIIEKSIEEEIKERNALLKSEVNNKK